MGTARKFLTFVAIGSLCLGCNLVVLYVATDLVGLHYVASTVASIALVAPLSWWLNRSFTFGTTGPQAPEFLRFGLATLLNYALVLASMLILVELAGLPYLVANVVTAVFLTLLNFFVMLARVYVVPATDVRASLAATAPMRQDER